MVLEQRSIELKLEELMNDVGVFLCNEVKVVVKIPPTFLVAVICNGSGPINC